jgi:hypothetical protein
MNYAFLLSTETQNYEGKKMFDFIFILFYILGNKVGKQKETQSFPKLYKIKHEIRILED